MTERSILDIEPGPFELNEYGLWCPSCGDLLIADHQIEDFTAAPEECAACGYPDDAMATSAYHLND